MPQMNKDRKEEYRLFLKNNRITYNKICRGCRQSCKQAHAATIVRCPNFISICGERDTS